MFLQLLIPSFMIILRLLPFYHTFPALVVFVTSSIIVDAHLDIHRSVDVHH
jgi:hypothetical protein